MLHLTVNCDSSAPLHQISVRVFENRAFEGEEHHLAPAVLKRSEALRMAAGVFK